MTDTTPEQQAREMLGGVSFSDDSGAWDSDSAEAVEIVTGLIRERDELREALDGSSATEQDTIRSLADLAQDTGSRQKQADALAEIARCGKKIAAIARDRTALIARAEKAERECGKLRVEIYKIADWVMCGSVAGMTPTETSKLVERLRELSKEATDEDRAGV